MRNALLNEGMKAIVFGTYKKFAYIPASDQMTWSSWSSTMYGYYTIIMHEYLTIKKNETICTAKGNMSNDELNIVLEALNYCDEQNFL